MVTTVMGTKRNVLPDARARVGRVRTYCVDIFVRPACIDNAIGPPDTVSTEDWWLQSSSAAAAAMVITKSSACSGPT
jgi:hypothetical protein